MPNDALPTDSLSVLAAMATPAVLLLANAMLILSTNQRLQTILTRVRETELAIAGQDVAPETSDLDLLNQLLLDHARRARAAHRGLLCFYASSATFVLVAILIGVASLGLDFAQHLALATAFLGSLLLACGATLLIAETWIGIGATDRRFQSVMDLCRQLARRRSAGRPQP
ncbi:MAG: DUF2721 domain-containing protein [Gemmatimonadetes bacterium]|uniref:DUF2721 domain-containing protein n=1 Tax=Candidatus Kutchimonas denitrificans TaxID=3056748 RepID=A0AAE5CCS9_9BACT|nr:DUF2721 domain-containing protein [Gemmatimonadota bacterium]NIR76383.1 DUF2721 domain-containing protein [Candidatus Kutchimonas denitrificans]NIS03193.1 DUF2721 domain-containing protein [Gemmatimonadota bacterium]NIT66366.1 DUF2721 domain-containing protein [Gemmatimonadota bacterium]NIU54445.1 DUF2721 domain-containing protein [Gemmatimonadota bacterium]